MLTDQEILAIYDREIRVEFAFPGARWERLDNIVRYVDLIGERGMVVYSRLDEDTVDDAIEAQIAYFEQVGQSFEWKVFGHDQPPDLRDRLERRGFLAEDPEALLIYDLAGESSDLLHVGAGCDIRRITEPERIADVRAVLEAVWNRDMGGVEHRLARQLRDHPESLAVYAAYDGDTPVSVGWLFIEQGQFASLWGGSTLPAHRGRGLYNALLAVRAREARALGKRFLTIDAGPMSRPIVERHGFRFMTMSYPRIWKVTR